MTIAHPRTLSQVLEALHANSSAQVLAGGTDFVVEVNSGHRRPSEVVSLRRVDELRGYTTQDGELVLRAGLTYTEMERDLRTWLPALADAARSVGSPQIRNAGTIGGNLATASPAGDTLPVLAALNAQVTLACLDGTRQLPLADFVVGPKRTALRPGEVVQEVRVRKARGPQQFLKVGTRNAMVIALATCALVLDQEARRVSCALGAVGPTPIRATEAERFLEDALNWETLSASAAAVARFGMLAASAARPITDHRGTAEYRRHAIGVIAARALERSLALHG